MRMILKNRTQEQHIWVEVLGRNVQVWPWKSIEVNELVGKWLLSNYWHIFMKVESDSDKIEWVNKDKESLRNQLSVVQEENKILAWNINTLSEKNSALEDIINTNKETIIKLKNALAEKWESKEEEEAEVELSDLEKVQIEYKEITGDDVPNNKKNDIERLQKKIKEEQKDKK